MSARRSRDGCAPPGSGRRRLERRRRAAGFTLIELLVVFVIITLLAAIALFRMHGIKENAMVATLKSDLRNVSSAQEAYYDDNQSYAGSISLLSDMVRPSAQVTIDIHSASTSEWGATATHSGTSVVCQVGSSADGAYLGAPTCAVP